MTDADTIYDKLKEKETPDEDFRETVEEIDEKRASAGVGRDGKRCVAEHTASYRGVTFTVRLFRYFTIDPVDINAELAKHGNKHVHINIDDDIMSLVEQLPSTHIPRHHHTLHSHNEGQSTKEQLESAIKQVKDSIDTIHETVEQREQKLRDIRSIYNKLEHELGDQE